MVRRISTTTLLALAVLSPLGCKKDEPKRTPEEEGTHLFTITCARCHGDDGTGGPPGPLGEPPPRNFHDAVFQAGIDDETIGRTIRNGKGRGMPAFGAVFTPEQIKDLTMHVRGFAPPGSRPVAIANAIANDASVPTDAAPGPVSEAADAGK